MPVLRLSLPRTRVRSRYQFMPTPAVSKVNQRPFNWKAAAPSASSDIVLPKLPVPDLQTTLARLKESLAPIAWSKPEYAEVERKIDEFGGGQGPLLHQRLLKHAQEQPHWLERWWDDGAYLGYRDSVRTLEIYPWTSSIQRFRSLSMCHTFVRFVTVTLECSSSTFHRSSSDGFDAHPSHLEQTPAARAAGLARAALIFRRNLKRGLLKPDATKESFLCMDTYR